MTPANLPTDIASSGRSCLLAASEVVHRALTVLSWGAPIPQPTEPKVWPTAFSGLSAEQRRLALVALAILGKTPEDAAELIETQRHLLRAGALRRQDDIEVLTILLRLWLGWPLKRAESVADIRLTYDRLRRTHWWPQGAEDVPLGAILACRPEPVSESITRIEALQLDLAEGDEVPGRASDLVVLLWSNESIAALIPRLRELRTALLLSGIALQCEDAAAVVRLALINRPTDMVMANYVNRRRLLLTDATHVVVGESLSMVADAVLLDMLTGASRQVIIAQVVLHAWLSVRPEAGRTSCSIADPAIAHRSR